MQYFKIRKIRLLIILGVIILSGLFIQTFKYFSDSQASGNVYFVSTSGNDNNVGTQNAPFRTFAKAISVLNAGDELQIFGGTYHEAIRVFNSGNSGSPITIRPIVGQQVVLDLLNQSARFIDISGSFIHIEGIEGKNSNGYCVNLTGQNIIAKELIVHDCSDHGIYADGQHIQILNNKVFRSNLLNQSRNSSSWGSGIKIRVGGDDILITGNEVFNNYGEGIAVTRGKNVVVANNQVYDNFSVNVYIDNSYDVNVEKNFSHCSANSGFERSGNRAYAFALGEENYTGWGAQLARIIIKNNIAAFCYKSIVSFNAGVSGGGLDNITIANNTFWGSTSTALSLAFDATKQRNTTITNNIIQQPNSQLAFIENKTGINLSHNFWMPVMPSPSTNATGTNDLSGDVRFAITPNYTPESYRLSNTSPAINAGKILTAVIDDFEGKMRSTQSSPGIDMGAIEFAAINVTTTSVPTPTTINPTATNIPSPTIITNPTLTITPTKTQTPIPNNPTVTRIPTQPPAGVCTYFKN